MHLIAGIETIAKQANTRRDTPRPLRDHHSLATLIPLSTVFKYKSKGKKPTNALVEYFLSHLKVIGLKAHAPFKNVRVRQDNHLGKVVSMEASPPLKPVNPSISGISSAI